MLKEYLVLDGDKSFKQDAWEEKKDAKGRVTKPARPARDEVEVAVRVDRQHRAVLRLPATALSTPAKRQTAIADICSKFALGEELAPGVQVVEVETRFTEAQPAMVTPEEKDEQGNVMRAESFTPAQPERTEFSFTLRLGGIHLAKLGLSQAEMEQADWKAALLARVPQIEVFTG